jgi:hypothetical protein
MSKPDPYLVRQARALSDSMLREQLAKEQKADIERQQAQLMFESVQASLLKLSGVRP